MNSAPDYRILRLARFTVPFHLLLPALLWQIERVRPDWVVDALVGFHLLFPIVIAGTYRWWRGRGEELAVLIFVDHVATFVGGMTLVVWLA